MPCGSRFTLSIFLLANQLFSRLMWLARESKSVVMIPEKEQSPYVTAHRANNNISQKKSIAQQKEIATTNSIPSQWFFVLVWFLFYGPSTHFRSFRARSVNLATLFLGKPPRQFTNTAHSFASNWQLLFLNQRKRENGRRNAFMTKSPRKNVPDVGIELGAACMPSELASDRATAPGHLSG